MSRRQKFLKILFIADPLANFDPVAETTLYLMKAAQKRGHEIYTTTPQTLSARRMQVHAQVQKLQVFNRQKDWFKIISAQRAELKSFDVILLRKDPPFDLAYLHHLYLLELIADEVYLMNHPSGILMGQEKLLPLPFESWTPDTLISAQKEDLLAFIRSHRQGVILKPVGDAGGRGVFLLRSSQSENAGVILETVTQNFTRHVIAQAYLPVGQKGDKRILLLGQEVLGAFIRKPARGEHRANLHAGGKAFKATLTRQEQELIGVITPTLTKLGLDFVGLDFIDGKLIEVNVTSPMGIHEINQTSNLRCERTVLDFLEERVKLVS